MELLDIQFMVSFYLNACGSFVKLKALYLCQLISIQICAMCDKVKDVNQGTVLVFFFKHLYMGK